MDFEKDIENLFGIINKVTVENNRRLLLQLYVESCSLTDYYYRKYLNHNRYSLSYLDNNEEINSIKINTIHNLVNLLGLLQTKFDGQERCFGFNQFESAPRLLKTDMGKLKW